MRTNFSQLCCADSYNKKDMKFVVPLQAGFSIFININTTFLKLIHYVKYQSLQNTVVLHVYIKRRCNKNYSDLKSNDFHKNFTVSKDIRKTHREDMECLKYDPEF
jgi:hypothetical protein